MKKIKSFDGIRTIAFTMIFISHIGRSFSNSNLFCFGAIGVQTFFILSGFLCLYSWRHTSYNGLEECWAYFLNKLKKFYPLHLVTFGFALGLQLYWLYKWPSSEGIKSLLKPAIFNLLLIQSFFDDIYIAGSYNGVSWFLSDILFLYFLTPALVKLIKKIPPPSHLQYVHIWL